MWIIIVSFFVKMIVWVEVVEWMTVVMVVVSGPSMPFSAFRRSYLNVEPMEVICADTCQVIQSETIDFYNSCCWLPMMTMVMIVIIVVIVVIFTVAVSALRVARFWSIFTGLYIARHYIVVKVFIFVEEFRHVSDLVTSRTYPFQVFEHGLL